MIPFNRALWLKESFTAKTKTPNWPCPICHAGVVQKDGESIKQLFSKETEKAMNNFMYDSKGLAEFRFHGYLKCSNCLERVIIAGKGNVQDSLGNVTRADFRGDRHSVFYPKYFEPHLNIFTITDNVPSTIVSELNAAFSTYWIDNGACGNKIRTAIEELLTDQKIKRTYLSKKRRRLDYSLHERIEAFRTKSPDLANHLLAIKWIGNSGSHGDSLSKSDLLDGFELLSHVLDQLYNSKNQVARLRKLSGAIIKKKGPLKVKSV